MSFFVDVVSEDSFYENLTLGVMKLLEANPCIKNVKLERRIPCDRSALTTWEQKHCCLLTEDLRNFYASTDGFLLTWSLEIAGEEFPIGRMEIKDFNSLKRHSGVTVSNSKEQNSDSTDEKSEELKEIIPEPNSFSSRCKLFEISECDGCYIFLTYYLQNDQEEPAIWLYNIALNQWCHLAENFSKYFRIMLVHLGLPLWQMCAVGLQLPPWLEKIYFLVGPHLLQSMIPMDDTSNNSADSSNWINVIDPAILKNKESHRHGSTKQRINSNSPSVSSSMGSTRKKSFSH